MSLILSDRGAPRSGALPTSRMNSMGARFASRPCLVGRRRELHAISSSSQPGPASSKLFDREHEHRKLDSVCMQSPADILLVLGPRSCGKTATLKSYFAGKQHAVYLDCRGIDASTPSTFIYALRKQLLQKVPRGMQQVVPGMLATTPELALKIADGLKISEIEKMGSTGSEELLAFSLADFTKALLDEAPSGASGPQDVFEVLDKLLTAWEKTLSDPGSYKPVLVIDEANVLMGWDKYPTEMAGMLRFLVKITKQDSRCHVLMVTSECSYAAWMDRAFGSGFWDCVVIGAFQEGEARMFLEEELRMLGSSVAVDDSAWAKVYEVCGGNAGALKRLARRVDREVLDWDKALRSLWSMEEVRIRALALGRDGYYTAAQYADAAVQLLDAKHHAVAQEDMQLLLGRHVVGSAASETEAASAGERVLLRLVEVNALSRRPFSDWAQDIPAEAFEREAMVVTAPSAVDLFCISRLRPRLDKTLEEWKQKQKDIAAAAAGEKVEANIKEVEKAIKELDNDIKEAKKQGDEDELVALRAEKQQLRAKKQQLEEKLMLFAIPSNGN